MKKEREFTCAYCGCAIHFGDTDAVTYDNEMFCSEECVLKCLEVEAYPWEYEARYEFESTEENGFLINFIDDEFFSNGGYIIWDKCKLNFNFYDPAYADQVGLNWGIEKFAEKAGELLREFKTFEFKPFDIDFSKLTDDEQVILGKLSFEIDVLGFILNYICLALSLGEFGKEFAYIPASELPSNLKRFNVAIDEKKGHLFIEREGIKAVLTGWPVNERAADF